MSVFISHAAADKALVDDVKTMVQTAVGLNPAEIFYSSSVGSGIPAGSNFVEYMGQQIRGASIVIAIITPAYLESRFCLAELGAVWYADDKDFHPLCIAVDYDELSATLTGIQTPRLDDRAALTDLLQRLCTSTGNTHSAGACTEAADKFLATLKVRLRRLQGRTLVAAEEVERLNAVNEGLAEELTLTRDQLREAQELFEKAKQAKTLEEIEELEPPSDVRELVERVLGEAEQAVYMVSSAVREVLPFEVGGLGMPLPDEWDRSGGLTTALEKGFLREQGDGRVGINEDWPNPRKALEAVKAAQEVLTSLEGDDRDWFIAMYEVPPDLSQTAAFDKLL